MNFALPCLICSLNSLTVRTAGEDCVMDLGVALSSSQNCTAVLLCEQKECQDVTSSLKQGAWKDDLLLGHFSGEWKRQGGGD